MTWWRELKWHIASILLLWIGRLTAEEMTIDGLKALSSLAHALAHNNPRFNVVRLRKRSS